MSYPATVYYGRDAVMSYPIASCRSFLFQHVQVVQGANMVSGFSISAVRYFINDYYCLISYCAGARHYRIFPDFLNSGFKMASKIEGKAKVINCVLKR